MKKILFFVTLLLCANAIGQTLRLPYKILQQTYSGDTIKTEIEGDTAKNYTNQKAFTFNKPIFVNGTQLGQGGGSMTYPSAGIPLSTGSAWGTSITNNSEQWNTAYSLSHGHDNKTVLDGISSSDITNWNGKIDASILDDGGTYRSTITPQEYAISVNGGGLLYNINPTITDVNGHPFYYRLANKGIKELFNFGTKFQEGKIKADTGAIFVLNDSVVTAQKLRAGTYGHFGSGTSQTWPATPGIMVYGGSSAFGTSIPTTAINASVTKESLPSNYKLKFDKQNRFYLIKELTENIAFDVDTAGQIPGATVQLQIYNSTGHSYTAYFPANKKFKPASGSSAIDSAILTANTVNTFLIGQFGAQPNVMYVYSKQPDMTLVGAPITPSAPSNFQATAISQVRIDLSLTAYARPLAVYDSIGGVSSNFSLLTTLPKNSTSYNHTGLSNGQHVYYKARFTSNGSDTLASPYASTNATTSALTTLSTPTINTPTVVSSTEIDLALAANISNNSGYDWTISRDGGTTFTTLASTATNVTTYNFTNGHADSTYYFKARAHGDLVTYNHSAYSAAVSAHTAAYPTDSLLAYYPFNGNGNVAAGTAGNSTINNATLVNDRNGNAYAAYSFNQANAYANIPIINQTIHKFTIAMWVYIVTPADYGNSLWCAFDNNSVKHQIYCKTASSRSYIYQYSGAPYGEGNFIIPSGWHHIALVIGTSSGSPSFFRTHLYIDGVLSHSVSNTSSTEFKIGSQFILGNNIGALSTGFAKAYIDDVFIYGKELTETEVNQVMNYTNAN